MGRGEETALLLLEITPRRAAEAETDGVDIHLDGMVDARRVHHRLGGFIKSLGFIRHFFFIHGQPFGFLHINEARFAIREGPLVSALGCLASRGHHASVSVSGYSRGLVIGAVPRST